MRHPVVLTATLSSIVLACCICACALDPSLDVNQFAHTAWKVRDGFTKSEIRAIAQTPDGYLWLGTEAGLLRFDGVRAVPWEPTANQPLPSPKIFSLLAARDGTLWIGTQNGLASWKDGKLTRYSELDSQYIFKLLEDRDGVIWVGSLGTPTGTLCSIDNGGVHCDGEDGRFGRTVLGLYQDSKGTLWVGVLGGLWRWSPGSPKFYPLPGNPNGIEALSEDADGTLLVGWNGGIYRFADGKAQPYPLPRFVRQFRARCIFRDRNGGLWIGTQTQGLFHVHDGRTDVFSSVDGLSGDDVNALFEDHEGTVWVATTYGLDRFRDFAVATLTPKQGLSNADVGSILAGGDGSLWLGDAGGLDRWNHGQIDPVPFGGKTGHAPSSLYQDDRGRIWVSTFSGVGYLEKDRFIPIPGIPGGNIVSISEDISGDIWIANDQSGLFRLSSDGKVQRIPWAELGHKDYASVLAADRNRGGLWIGYFLGGISYFSDGQVRTSYTTADGLVAGRISDFYFDKDHVLWVSTEGGLSRLKDGHLATLTGKNGLPCDTIHWAIEDDDRAFWLYTACGLVRITRSELDAWSTAADKKEDTTRRIQVTVFDSSDGVRILAYSGRYHPQVAKTPDGKLWFLPKDGVSIVDPRHLPFNKVPPPVHIEKITADGKNYDPVSGVKLPPHLRDLAIDYTALSLVAPEKIHFRYKLEGQDPDWKEVVNDRRAQYSNLAPRHYTFRVMACNNSGLWNEAGTSLEFSVLPAFYQTNWFRLLCVTAFLILLWAIYRLRLHQMQRQFALGLEALVGERLRIARELHDTLLQTFQAAVFQFQAARKLLARNADNAMEMIDEAIQTAEEGIKEGRSAIRDLRPEPAAQRELSELLDAAGRELAAAHELNGPAPSYRVLVEGKQQGLSPMLQDEVYRISREVIRNAFAHAAASHIEVEVRYDQDHLRLRVRDDGRGIEPKVLAAGGESGHFGIPGMRERAERIGARLDFWSEMGAGAEIQLTIPASMAYQKRNGHRFRLFHWADGADEKKR
jgi:signal transduction histidine kinase/ligand-binding sensor domain-containing protein